MTDATERLRERSRAMLAKAYADAGFREASLLISAGMDDHSQPMGLVAAALVAIENNLASLDEITAERDAAVKRAEEALAGRKRANNRADELYTRATAAEERVRVLESLISEAPSNVAEKIASEFKGFWAAEDLVGEIPAMIADALSIKDAGDE